MTTKRFPRRDFLRLLGLGGASLLGGGVLSACGQYGFDGVIQVPNKANTGASSSATLDVEIALEAVEGEVQIFSGKPTRVWRYQGRVLKGAPEVLRIIPDSYLGPIINVHKGQHVRIHFGNQIPEASTIHWHGLHVPPKADGHPRLAIDPGETYVYDFTVLDRAGTYWYHPHPHGRTGPQTYLGLAGLFLISDEEETALGLPSGEYDVPLVIQDRTFDHNNQLVYGEHGMIGFLGNQVLVNGQPDFTLPAATRPYRLRLHNGSNSRIYKLAWEDGSPLMVIGTDGGLLGQPVQRDYVTLAPAQRVDLWVDFSGRQVGSQVRLMNLPSAAPGGETAFPILKILIERDESVSISVPERLSVAHWYDRADAVNRRTPREFVLAMGMGMGRGMVWTINGATFQMTATSKNEVVRLGDLEVWEFINRGGGSGMMGGGMALPHPMHIHGLQFQIMEREIDAAGRPAWSTLHDGFVDDGWHDTVLVMPGERVKVLLKFEDFAGLYLYHCHNLEHEDMGMMRNYRVEG